MCPEDFNKYFLKIRTHTIVTKDKHSSLSLDIKKGAFRSMEIQIKQ
jgi:hypothetical protein